MDLFTKCATSFYNARILYNCTERGNSDDSCSQNSYPIGYYVISGCGTPAY